MFAAPLGLAAGMAALYSASAPSWHGRRRRSAKLRRSLGDGGRSVGPKAPLQDQFGKGKSVGRSGIQAKKRPFIPSRRKNTVLIEERCGQQHCEKDYRLRQLKRHGRQILAAKLRAALFSWFSR